MSKISKTAKASMGTGPVVAKKTISDEELIRLLRIDVASGIYPSSQGTHALLRAYDAERNTVATLAGSTTALLARAEKAEEELEQAKRALRSAVDRQITVGGGQQEHDVIMREIANA